MIKNNTAKFGRSFQMVLGFTILYLIFPKVKSASDNAQCYDDLECFSKYFNRSSGVKPFFPPPQSLQEINASVFCYTRESSERYNVSLSPGPSLNSCPFNSSRRTVFITHGFLSNGTAPWLLDVTLAYLKRMDANVLILDWGGGAGSSFLQYFQAASNITPVAKLVIRFLKYLAEKFGLKYDTLLHLIGFSLGAHLWGLVGKELTPWRITGLDPAGLGFNTVDIDYRLDPTDAIFVDVIHTSAATFIVFFGFGFTMSCGHVDFFVNGGYNQPNCTFPQFPQIKDISDLANVITPTFIKLYIFCNHLRSHRLFLYSLYDNCTIWGYPTSESSLTLRKYIPGDLKTCTQPNVCDSRICSPMGLDTPYAAARGLFDVCTTGKPPYCLGNSGVKKKSNKLAKILGFTRSD